ncbi:MAG: 3'-5' exonuclease [Actinomycetota bacterium]
MKKSILDLANVLSQPIRENGRIHVEALRAREGASQGEVACGVYEDMSAEAIAVAEYFSPLWFAPDRLSVPDSEKSSFAVLVRKRSQIPEIEAALRAAGMPVEVLGVGGLMHVAEVADLITLAKVIVDPDAGASLMRHLTGPRINLGAADIAALGRYSRSLSEKAYSDSNNRASKIALGNPAQEEADDQIQGSLIDALDEIAGANQNDFSSIGYARLVRFAADLRRLRSRAAGSLLDLLSELESYLFLDSEVALRDWPQSGRRHLDRFLDEAAKFSRSGGSIQDFLVWLSIAESEEGGLKSGTPRCAKRRRHNSYDPYGKRCGVGCSRHPRTCDEEFPKLWSRTR